MEGCDRRFGVAACSAEAALARGINVFSAYGLSETCPLLTTVHLDPANESDVAARLKAGRPAAMVELRVVDTNAGCHAMVFPLAKLWCAHPGSLRLT